MEKKMEIKDIAAERERLTDIFRKMLHRKREEQRTAPERYSNDVEFQKALQELRKENAERGTPFIRVKL